MAFDSGTHGIYFQVGDKVNQRKFIGAPAVVSKVLEAGDKHYGITLRERGYVLTVDVSNHPDGYDEKGDPVKSFDSFVTADMLQKWNLDWI